MMPLVGTVLRMVPALLVMSGTAFAQGLPLAAVEGIVGAAAFVDETAIGHSVFGAAARVHLTPRVSVGPELTFMRGPGRDRDLFVLANVYFDFISPRGRRLPAVSPYVVAGTGWFHHANEFGSNPFSHNAVTVVGGAGARIRLTDQLYVAPDYRVGGEDLHARATVTVGVRLR